MGNRGVDLAQLKAQRAAKAQAADEARLLVWARQLERWLEEPIEPEQIVEAAITVQATGQRLVLSKRLADE